MFNSTTHRKSSSLGTQRLVALVVLLLVFGLVPIRHADATLMWNPVLTISGEPTSDEFTDIQRAWTWLNEAFPSTATCMQPLTVHVVDRVEDYYSTPINFSIAAFYRYPPSPTVYVEHGKVRPEVIIHEFAHHMDLSCGFGVSAIGDEFLEAEGFSADQGWIQGTSWSRVPAERFAEGVLSFMGVGHEEIVVGSTARDLISRWSTDSRDIPTEVRPGLVLA